MTFITSLSGDLTTSKNVTAANIVTEGNVDGVDISDFKQDPLWGSRLIADPILRGVKRTSALGVHMQILLVTRAGEQWTTEREFQRRILKALHRRGVDLADGLEISPSGLLPSGAR